MSRTVDPNASNLSDDDKLYLIQRGLLPTDKMLVEDQRKLVDPESDTLSLEDRANTGDVNTANLSIADLESLLEARRKEQEAVEPKKLFGSASGAADDDDDEPLEPPYDQYSKAQLTAEIQRRNEDLDDADRMLLAGNKDELVARLEADDEDED